MNGGLEVRIAQGLKRAVAPPVVSFGERLARSVGAQAVLFYGSNLRTGSLEGVLDYYLLLPGKSERGIWPLVSYHEWQCEGHELRAKAAAMTLAKFAEAASGELLDTTVWSRFVQPSALVWHDGEEAEAATMAAVAAATATAARLAVALGPISGSEAEFWLALFRATYDAELRIENTDRAQSILELNRGHFDGLLLPALAAAGIGCEQRGTSLTPRISPDTRRKISKWWSKRRRFGKPLNLVRLLRAASTFEGAARYAAWKIERHTGVHVDITPWRERHPVLAAPGVLLSVWRNRGRR